MIPAIQEINFPSYATLHQATASFAEMGERSITTQVRIDGDVVPDFEGWELGFKGERFILNTKEPQAAKDTSTRNSLVDLQFQSWVIQELKRYFFFEAASVGAGTAIADKYKASVNLNVEDFAVLFNQVLNHYFGGKIVFSLYMSGQGQYSTDRALVEIDYTYIWDVLVKFYEIYGVRWRFEYNSTTDVYTIKAGWPDSSIDDHDFEYGYKGGLLRFERQVQDVDIHNILLGRGGEKNLPYRYFKRIDEQNPDWAADPDAIPELASINFDRLRDINFRWYVRGWMQNPNHDTSWEDDGYVYPTYSIASDSPYYFAYQKGLTDETFNPVEYVRDLPSIEDYGERWGALEDNDEVFPTIQGVSRSPIGRIDETVAVSEIVTDDISAMAQNAAVEKSINRMSISLYGNTNTQFEILSEEFTIPEGSTGNISYAPFGTDDLYPGLVRFDTDNSTLVAVSGSTEYPISAIPAGTYRLKLNMVIAREGQATSATGTFGIENIVLTTSAQDADAWKPTFDIWVKNIWNTAPQQGESDVQYAERVWLPILGDRAGNEAKVVFSTGFMSVSEDYEFTIAAYPVRDTSKSINGVQSEWRITLRKSDAEFDATGLYIPNASTGGKPVAGDKFFFIGIDMPHMYVTLAEEDLNTNKSAQLDTEAAVNPTWIMNLDKVRVHTLEDNEYGQTLADRLAAGTKVWITDPRFTPGRRLQLYIQSITYTWNEPTDDSPYLVPDIEVVLSDKVMAVDSVVQKIQSDVSAIKQQYARISDVEAVVRSVAEPMFLKKTGEADSSDSPTQFASKVTSAGFRQGGVGGSGWGIYRDNTEALSEGDDESEGDSVIEVDRVVVRKEMQVNSLVVNQVEYRGGMEIISAAKIEISKVIDDDANGVYVCYFDQRRNSVANNFQVDDIAFGQVFTPQNSTLRYYKCRVVGVDVDRIMLSKTVKDGAGVPQAGDVVVQFGSYTNSARRYVIVRDVIGGGYERMLSGLNSVSSTGKEYYFAGRQNNSGARWFVGDSLGDYAEYENGVLTIKANVVFKAGQNIPGLSDLSGRVDDVEDDLSDLSDALGGLSEDLDTLTYLKTALPKSDTIVVGGLVLSKVIALRDSNNAIKSGINGDPSLSTIAAWYGGPMADKEATPTPASYAQTLFRFDGSGYLAGGNIHWDNQGYGGIPGITWSNDGTNDVVTIGANVRLASVSGDTVTDLLNAVNSIKDWFEIVDGNIHVKNNRGFYSDSFISAGGLSSGGGTAGGNATLVAQTYGGTLSATGISPINFYSKEKVDELLLNAGSVQTVAGVSPVSGDILAASLQTALGLGAAAYKAVGSVASGNTGLVTGDDVWTAIDNLPEPMVFKGSLGTGGTITSLPAASSANEGYTYKVITAGTYASQTAKVGDTFISNGSSWVLIPSGDEPEGTVTSVGLSMPTGFSVSSSPITSSGTLTVGFASGYSLPTTSKQTTWDTIAGYFSDGALTYNHGGTGLKTFTGAYRLLYSTSASVLTTLAPNTANSKKFLTMTGTGSAGAAPSWGSIASTDLPSMYIGRTAVTFSAANATLLGITAISNAASSSSSDKSRIEWVTDADGNGNGAWHFIGNLYADGWISAGGLSSGGGSEGASLAAVWTSLANETVITPTSTTKIASDHIKLGSGLGIDGSGNIYATNTGTITSVTKGTATSGGAVTTSNGAVTIQFPTIPTSLPASDVYSWAKASSKPSYAFSEISGTASDSQIPTLAISKISGLQTALDAKASASDLTALTTRVTTDEGITDDALQALQSQIDSVSARNNFDELTATTFFADQIAVSSLYAAEIMLNGADLGEALGTLNSRASTLEGYFTNGSANTAVQLLNTRTIWGQNFNGTANVTGSMSSVGSITMNGSISGTTTISASGQVEVGSLKLAGATPTLTWDSSASAWKLTGNFYATGFISAGGVSSGGGSEGVNLTAVWNNLVANEGEGLNKVINVAHIPSIASLSGDLTVSRISDIETWISGKGYITSFTNTWRNVYTGGTSRVGTGTDTKAVNFSAGSGITISYKAAGTGSGQSGSANYFSVEIGVTANTYQPLDSDLTAIAAINSGTGLLKRSVSGSTVSWTIDTNTYLTGITAAMMNTAYGFTITGTANTTYALATIASNASNGNTAYGWGDWRTRVGTLETNLTALTTRVTTDEGIIDEALQSLQAQIDSVSARNNFDELTATTFFADQIAASSLYAAEIKLNGADLAEALGALSSRASTLEGYFISGVANSAAKLTTVSKTAWGQTYWTANGVPDSISGNMSSVGSITMNGSISGTTTISASGQVEVGSLKLAGAAPTLAWDSSASAWHLSGNFYADGFISAGGVSDGGGSSGIDLDAMWSSLTNNSADTYAGTKIAAAHIPDMASDYGYLKANQTITLTGVVTGSGATAIATSIADGALTIAMVGGLRAELDSKTGNTGTVTSVGISMPTGFSVSGSPVTSSGTLAVSFSSGYSLLTSTQATTWNGKQDAISDLSTIRSNASLGATANGWGNHADAGYLTSANGTTISEALQSLQSQIDSVSARNNFDELTATTLFADMLSASSAYIDSITGSLSGNATTASYLVSSSYGVGGAYNPVYFSGGRPAALSATVGSASVPMWMSGGTLTAITPSSMFSALSSSAATNLSMTIAGQLRSITDLYAKFDKDGGEIAPNMTTIGIALRSLQSQVDSVSARNGYDELTTTTFYADMLSVGANAYVGGTLQALGATTLNSTLTVSGIATFNSDAHVSGKLYLSTAYMEYVSGNSGIHANVGFYSDSYITAGAATSSSDARLKDDITAVSASRAWDVLMALKPSEWVWNGKKPYLEGKSGAGLVAQEVAPVLPDAVLDLNGELSLQYNMLHAFEIAGLQDHERRIAELERENAELRKEVERLRIN